MEAKDCIKLANLSKDLLVSRRQIEWRINFAFWAGIVAIAVFLYQAGYSKSNLGIWYWIIVIVLGIGSLIFVGLYLSIINASHKKDLDLIIYYREKADPELVKHINESKKEHGKKTKPEDHIKYIEVHPLKYFWKSKYWRYLLQYYLITVLIFGGAVMLLSIPNVKTSEPRMTFRFKGGPLKGTVGVLDVQASELFYNRFSIPEITPDGKVVKGELIQGALSQSAANLPFYRLNSKTSEYYWFPKD